jgi:hypothetical protein
MVLFASQADKHLARIKSYDFQILNVSCQLAEPKVLVWQAGESVESFFRQFDLPKTGVG